jgi:hypothetical protein
VQQARDVLVAGTGRWRNLVVATRLLDRLNLIAHCAPTRVRGGQGVVCATVHECP